MAAARHITVEDRAMRKGGWQARLGNTLEGRTLGLVGLGRLGAQIAEIAKVFRMSVVAWSRNLTAERAAECGARLVSKAELFEMSDYVSVHLRLSERTRDLIAAPDLARMKPTAWIVNTSRGPIINENDLIEALEKKVIAGAALDVFDIEPLPADHPLRRLDNTVLSPHKGYVAEESYRVFYAQTAEDIRAWLDGRPIRVIEHDAPR